MSQPASPSFIVDTDLLESNLQILADVSTEAECKIVLALKAFALPSLFPLIGRHLDGCCASGIHEATLSHENMGKHTLVYSPAYKPEELQDLLEFASHIDFNSIHQWERFREVCLAHPRYANGDLQFGLRINPEHSTGSVEKYDPCGPVSRLGITRQSLIDVDLTGISGLHFHTLCEQFTDDLASTLDAVHECFGDLLSRAEISWLNIGGGHWITKPNYDRAQLIELIKKTKEKYHLEELWIEPGEAVAIHTGTLEASVLDIVENGEEKIAILDVSPTAHMPDTLEMPYLPEVILQNQGKATDKIKYHLGGTSCLAGDQLGPYYFSRALKLGDRISFQDMAHYTMVKSTFFNGVTHPSIYLHSEQDGYSEVKKFGYQDFFNKLG